MLSLTAQNPYIWAVPAPLPLDYYSLDNEKALLISVSESNEQAFADLYRYYAGELQPLIRKYAGMGIETAEVVQEIFLKVWLNREKLPELENFRAWLFTVASREYLYALRSRLYYEKKLEGYSGVQPDAAATPYERTHMQAIRQCVGEAVNQLTDRRRAIYDMSRNRGMKIDEIAQELGLSRQTVKNTLLTVMKSIRDYLTAAGYGPYAFIIYFAADSTVYELVHLIH